MTICAYCGMEFVAQSTFQKRCRACLRYGDPMVSGRIPPNTGITLSPDLTWAQLKEELAEAVAQKLRYMALPEQGNDVIGGRFGGLDRSADVRQKIADAEAKMRAEFVRPFAEALKENEAQPMANQAAPEKRSAPPLSQYQINAKPEGWK